MESSLQNIHKIVPIISSSIVKDELNLIVSNSKLIVSLTVLKNHLNYKFTLLTCISGVDLLGLNYRFSIVYDLLSISQNIRVRVKTYVNETTPVNSCLSVYINANWWEREVWDLYGIYFQKHPDLRRILTDYGFEGYPMRKDFPLSGYVEVRYDASKKRVVVEPLELAQEFRAFFYETPW